MKDKSIHILDSYKHARDTEQDRVRVGDKVVNRYGRATKTPWRVERIFKLGARGQVRYDLTRVDENDPALANSRIGVLANEYQKRGDQS